MMKNAMTFPPPCGGRLWGTTFHWTDPGFPVIWSFADGPLKGMTIKAKGTGALVFATDWKGRTIKRQIASRPLIVLGGWDEYVLRFRDDDCDAAHTDRVNHELIERILKVKESAGGPVVSNGTLPVFPRPCNDQYLRPPYH